MKKGFTITNKKTRGGFTLIELLIVISVISLLSTIVFYSSTETKKKAEDSHMKAEAAQVGKAIELYSANNNGKVPGGNTLSGQLIFENDTENDNYETVMGSLSPYISAIPTSPSGSSYYYKISEDGESAVFIADLNNEEEDAICVTIGDYDFGREGDDNSCEGIIDSSEDESPVDSCGEPPYITGQSDQIVYDWGGRDYSIEVYATDPEGEEVIFEMVIWDPFSGTSCGMYGNSAYCSLFDPWIEYVYFTFTMETEGCPKVEETIYFDGTL
jgi:prepilin-type N-terminal cleavage/methylation domain-containing protein